MSGAGRKRRFTEQMLERLKPPASGRIWFSDEVCPGLILRVSARGTKSFSVIYKVPGEGGVTARGRLLRGRQHRVTLGCWPVTGIVAAREKARELLGEATTGTDPRAHMQEANLLRHTNTFAAVQDRFIERHAKPNLKNWKTVKSTFDLHVRPLWGDRPLTDIRRADVHALLDDIVEDDRIGTAREVRKHLSSFFNWALDREIVKDNPTFHLKRDDLARNENAGRSLSDDELRAIWLGTAEFGYPFQQAYRALMLTGQRRTEWATASRSEIDSANRWLEIPKGRYKGKRDHIVPLVDPVWEIVESLPKWAGNDYFLFSTRGGKTAISGFSKAKLDLNEYALAALRRIRDGVAVDLPYYRVHDFRVTCETRLASLGFGQEIRDAVLGHAKVGLQKTYNKHDYLEEKRAALATYASHVLEIVRQ